MIFKYAKLLFEEVWAYVATNQTKRNEANYVYSECHRLKSADDLVKRLNSDFGTVTQEFAD